MASVGQPFDKKVRLLGTVALVLAILKLLYFSFRILQSTLTLLGVTDEPHRAATRALDTFHQTIAMADGARAVPFVVVGILLIPIALRLQRGDASALTSLRRWVFWSFGAVAISICVHAFVIIPVTMKWNVQAAGSLPSLPFFDTKQMVSALSLGVLVFAMVFGSALRLVIPVVLYVWAGRLLGEQKRALPGGAPRT